MNYFHVWCTLPNCFPRAAWNDNTSKAQGCPSYLTLISPGVFQFLDIFINLVEEKNLSFKTFICYWHQGWTFSHVSVYQGLFLHGPVPFIYYSLKYHSFRKYICMSFFFLHRYFSFLCFIYYVFPAGYFSFDELHIYEIKISFYIVLGATLSQM